MTAAVVFALMAAVPVEQRVADLLKQMTLEEKAAQVQTLWQDKKRINDDAGRFSPSKAAAVLPHGLGQVARPSEKKGPRDMAEFTNAIQKWVLENTRLRIPVMFHEEALHGHAAPRGTHYPQPIALASTWDLDLVERVYSATALEVRARGAQHVLTPVLDLARDPRWGRTEETFGEDPYLVSRLGVASIRGFQGGSGPSVDGKHVLATAKHFVHGVQENGINVGPSNISERELRDTFLVPFEAAIREAGAGAVMASYNEIDGIPAHANRWLLEDVLRREWGFDGFVVADYNAITDLITLHHVAGDNEEAARLALETGVDLELPDPRAYPTLIRQVRDGRVSEAVLDRAVARILRAKFLSGLFEQPYADPDEAERVTNAPAHQALALEAARKAIILLKNEGGALPLDRSKLRTIAVIGPNAERVHLGGYSDDPGRGVSILEGIRAAAGPGVRVDFAEGVRITKGGGQWYLDKVEPSDPEEDRRGIAAAVKVARGADVAVLVLGDNEETSREAWAKTHLGDRPSLDLFGRQQELLEAVVATGKPTVLFLINGRPASIPWAAEHIPAILEGWYLGQETGTAVADVLFGVVNPSGKLPITIPRSAGHLPAFYNHKPSARRGYVFDTVEPLFPFGHGLSYTTFRYGTPRVSPATIGPGGVATVSVDVTNTGARAGDEIVQLYVRDLVSSATRPVKELKGFRRVTLAPGETKPVEFRVGPAELSFHDARMQRVVEPGAFDLMVGGSSVQLTPVKLEVR